MSVARDMFPGHPGIPRPRLVIDVEAASGTHGLWISQAMNPEEVRQTSEIVDHALELHGAQREAI